MFVTLTFPPTAKQASAPVLPKDYLGMLEYKREDEPRLIQNIILGISTTLMWITAVALFVWEQTLTW